MIDPVPTRIPVLNPRMVHTDYLALSVETASKDISRAIRPPPRPPVQLPKPDANTPSLPSASRAPSMLSFSQYSRTQDEAERIVQNYMPTKDMVHLFEKLDVLVCGKCQSVFHMTAEFVSHGKTCTGDATNARYDDSLSDQAIAMVIWENTMRRKLDQAGVTYTNNGKCTQLHLFSETVGA